VFRQNYWGKLDKAAQEYRSAKNEAERKRVRERFRSDLAGEFKFLKEELGLTTAETLFTVETAALVTLGAAIVAGGPLGLTAGVTAARSVLGKLRGAKSKRNAAMDVSIGIKGSQNHRSEGSRVLSASSAGTR